LKRNGSDGAPLELLDDDAERCWNGLCDFYSGRSLAASDPNEVAMFINVERARVSIIARTALKT